MKTNISQLNKEIPDYTLHAIIGSSGFGVTYLATHDFLEKHVAIKIFPQELATDLKLEDRFRDYVYNHSNLSSNKIAKVLDTKKTPSGLLYIIMEYIYGKSLRTLIDEKFITETNIFAVSHALAMTLQISHEAGFYNHTIKPENILIEPEGTILLSDIGISPCIPQDIQLKYLGANSLKYKAPEDTEINIKDARSNIYSLAAILYEGITGVLPDKDHPIATDKNITSDKLREFLHQCLNSDRSKRITTMIEFIVAIQSIQKEVIPKAVTKQNLAHLITRIDTGINTLASVKNSTNSKQLKSKRQRKRKKSARNKAWKIKAFKIFAIGLSLILVASGITYLVNLLSTPIQDELAQYSEFKNNKKTKKNQPSAPSVVAESINPSTKAPLIPNDSLPAQAEQASAEQPHLPKSSPPLDDLKKDPIVPHKSKKTIVDEEIKIELTPSPDVNANDLIIRKGWINRSSVKALVILNFGNQEADKEKNKEPKDLDEFVFNKELGVLQKKVPANLIEKKLDRTITFRCAYSIDDKWDTIKPENKDNPPTELKPDEDIAAGSFNTKWLGINDVTNSMLQDGVQMKHVFQIDLSNEQIASTAKYILIKINHDYTTPESKYTNNIIALPLKYKSSWVLISNHLIN